MGSKLADGMDIQISVLDFDAIFSHAAVKRETALNQMVENL